MNFSSIRGVYQKSYKNNETNALFGLGQIFGTPDALDALIEAEQELVEILLRHVTDDWGDLDDEEKKENELSVKEGFRILSAYNLETDVKVWILTEWNRSVTAILLPEDH